MSTPSDIESSTQAASEPPVIYVVDDDLSHLRSISRLLRASGYRVVIHNSAAEFLDELEHGVYGCVITDLMMPEMNGLALQQALCDAGNPLPVLFLTGHGDIPTTVRAMRNGADNYLTKNAPKEKLLTAINEALEHSRKELLRQARMLALRKPFEQLTTREMEVLSHVVQGLLNKQIADELGIHERTVKLHRTHLTTKLGIHSVAELTTLAHEAGIFR